MTRNLLTIIVVLVLAGAIYAIAANRNDQTENTPVNQDQQAPDNTQNNQQQEQTGNQPQTVEIKMTAEGFDPARITIKKGDTVTFVNQDTRLRWPASGPHPTHTNYPAFDPKQGVAVGGSWSFTFDQAGNWPFHDHLYPTIFGAVTVTE